MMPRMIHGGYPGRVVVRDERTEVTDVLVRVNGRAECALCGAAMHQEPNPLGGDSWYYRCQRGHETWVGK